MKAMQQLYFLFFTYLHLSVGINGDNSISLDQSILKVYDIFDTDTKISSPAITSWSVYREFGTRDNLDCTGLFCENGGTMISNAGDCHCLCPSEVTGLHCEYDIKKSMFPRGGYALPMSKDGCPEGPSHGWGVGYLYFNCKEPIESIDLNYCGHSYVEDEVSSETNITGPFGRYSLQMNFCYKLRNGTFDDDIEWPTGNYGIYGTAEGCPKGFSGYNLTVCLPQLINYNIDGHVPLINIQQFGTFTDIKFLYCRRNQNQAVETNITWNSVNPFHVIKDPGFGAPECSHAQGYNVSEEHFPFRLLAYVWEFPYPTSRFTYCQYMPKEYKFTVERKRYGDTYSDMIAWNGFPGKGYSGLDLGLHRRTCGGDLTIGLPINDCSQEELWVMIDGSKSILVSAILLSSLWNYELSDLGTISHVFVGYDRWGFMNDGALLCRHREHEEQLSWSPKHKVIRCYRSIHGRYVTIVYRGRTRTKKRYDEIFVSILSYDLEQGQKHKSAKGDGHETSQLRDMEVRSLELQKDDYYEISRHLSAVLLNNTETTSQVCSEDIGMRDFGIKDSQLTASSWQADQPPQQARPQHRGWCADPSDSVPYIQIDLVFVTTVDGFVLLNWYLIIAQCSFTNGTNHDEKLERGASSFRIEYGTTLDLLRIYNTIELSYDQSRSLDEPQIFHFSEPFLARYIRVFPQPIPGTNITCMMFELLGCRIYDDVSLECVNSSSKVIVNSSMIHVPVGIDPTSEVTSSNSECQDICLRNISDCRSTRYETDGMCSLYGTERHHNYVQIPLQSTNILSSVMCTNDDVEQVEGTLRLHDSWRITFDTVEIDVNVTGTISSTGYPLNYANNAVYKWRISLPGKFLVMMFSDISLRVYENDIEGLFMNTVACRDSILITGRTEELMSNPYYAATVSGYTQSFHFRFNSDNNGETPAVSNTNAYNFMTVPDVFFVEFITCPMGTVVEDGRGFRLHITETEQPYCQFGYLQISVCMKAEMEVIAPCFLGYYDGLSKQHYIWDISPVYEYESLVLAVTIEEFDISCYSESTYGLKEAVQAFAPKQCNSDRPIGRRYYIAGSFVIDYYKRIQQCNADQMFHEGFQLSYRYLPKGEIFPNVMLLDQDPTHGHFMKRACSIELEKCYTIETVPLSSWRDVAQICQAQHTLLVNIKSPEEQKYIQAVLMDYFIDTDYTHFDWFDIFIGLSRYVDTSGVYHEYWSDGTPLTFTSWDTYEPSDTIFNECTYMRMDRAELEISWRTVSCILQDQENFREDAQRFAVCEYATNYKGTLLPDNLTVNMKDLTVDNVTFPNHQSTLFRCLSGEWISQLARCNRIAECSDYSDEANCTNAVDGCEVNEFACANGQCIHMSQVCDFIKDCTDVSDEYCDIPSCTEEEFSCTSRQCIPLEGRCDAVKQCKDGSDEQNCEACLGSETFQCGDTSCISARLVCDKHVDCPDGADEQSCVRNYTTCDQFWTAGYINSGYFMPEDGKYTIYCDFSDIAVSGGTIQMTYLNYDWAQQSQNQYVLETPGVGNALEMEYECTQKLVEILHRERLRQLELDDRVVERLEHSQQISTYSNTGRATSTLRLDNLGILGGYKTRLTTTKQFDKSLNTVQIGYTVCEKAISELYDFDEEPTLFCRYGVESISENQRCLYDKDVNGIIHGCRSLAHLQNCDNFTCPQDHFKCPGSFCLPFMYVCDGRIDCSDGEDERICACESSGRRNIVILVPSYDIANIPQSSRLFEIATQLGGQLYSNQSTIKVLLVKISSEFNGRVHFVGNTILSNNEHITKASSTYGGQEGESTEHALFGELSNMDESRGLIWITDERSRRETEEAIFQMNASMPFDKYLLLIDVNFRKGISVTLGPLLTTVTARDFAILGTVGTQLFPDICIGSKYVPCVGGYRCSFSKVCIPLYQVCDGKRHCPLGEDEQHCHFNCPTGCDCGISVVNCSHLNSSDELGISTDIRSLDVSQSAFIGKDILIHRLYSKNLAQLVVLNASMCGINLLNQSSFESLTNLMSLDISMNTFTVLPRNTFKHLKFLTYLYMTRNHFLNVIEPGAFTGLSIRTLRINYADMKILQADTFAGLNLTALELSNNNISEVRDFAFSSLFSRTINIKGNPIQSFSKGMFIGAQGLVDLQTPEFKFCCLRPSYLPEKSCIPYRDEFSSCEDMLSNTTLQALIWTIGILALIGNILSLVYRLLYDMRRMKLGYGIFVTNLAVADMCMGIYMLIIAVADKVFRDRYIEMDDYWRGSAWCKLAGVLSTVSSEASVLFMCLITIDRVLVIKYPFGQLRFRVRSALAAVAACWFLAFIIALLPVLYTDYFQNRFYSKSSVCLALPLTRDRPPGWLYSTMIFIGFNMITFALIAVGQWMIYMELKKQKSVKKSMKVTRSNDLKVARNLLLVVTTDFLCWFPVGVMGIIAWTGHPIPGEVYAWTAVMILPINSALNPFMYTLSAIFSGKQFTPSVEEQSRPDSSKDTAKTVLDILPFIQMDNRKGTNQTCSLDDLLKTRKLELCDLSHVINLLVKFVSLLHDNSLILRQISEGDIYVTITKVGRIGRNVRIQLKESPVLSAKKNDHAEDMYQIGRLVDRLVRNY